MILLIEHPPEGFIKQKYRYVVVIIFTYAIFDYTINLREGFKIKSTELFMQQLLSIYMPK